MKSWYETWPDRLQRELDALKKAGVDFEVDENLLKKGVVRISMSISELGCPFDLPGDQLSAFSLVAVFPDSYPYFRPEVFAPDWALYRHQNPVEKNLCLIPRSTESWHVETLLASLLQTQLGKVFVKGKVSDLEVVRQDALEQAEPVSEFYVNGDATVIFDVSVLPEIGNDFGEVELFGNIKVGYPKNGSIPNRFAVLEAGNTTNENIISVPPAIRRTYTNMMDGLLFRLKSPPLTDPAHVLVWLREKLKEQHVTLRLPNRNISFKDGVLKNIVGLVFPEEVSKGTLGNGCLFLIECSKHIFDPMKKSHRSMPNRQSNFFAKTVSWSLTHNNPRVPALRALAGKTISIVGLGALGGFTAIELARSGIGTLKLLDTDIVDGGMTIRWPLGLSAVGMSKVQAIGEFVENNYPETKTNTRRWRLGTCRANVDGSEVLTTETEAEVLEEFLNGSDLLIDATAEVGIHHYLSLKARDRNIPYISLSATPGGYGGSIIRIVPGVTKGCWMCLKYWQEDRPDEMIPRSDDLNGTIQPAGCGDITFTGAGFDLQNISLAATRIAVSTLCSGAEGGYGKVAWDFAVLNLFDREGIPILPDWRHFLLPIHPKCPYCHVNEA